MLCIVPFSLNQLSNTIKPLSPHILRHDAIHWKHPKFGSMEDKKKKEKNRLFQDLANSH